MERKGRSVFMLMDRVLGQEQLVQRSCSRKWRTEVRHNTQARPGTERARASTCIFCLANGGWQIPHLLLHFKQKQKVSSSPFIFPSSHYCTKNMLEVAKNKQTTTKTHQVFKLLSTVVGQG
jgi:hypothetical protein